MFLHDFRYLILTRIIDRILSSHSLPHNFEAFAKSQAPLIQISFAQLKQDFKTERFLFQEKNSPTWYKKWFICEPEQRSW